RILSSRTPEELIQAGVELIEQAVTDPPDYGTGLSFEHKRVKRSTYSRSQNELQIALADTRETIQEFLSGFKDVRNPTSECVWKCAFLKICLEEDPVVINAFYDPADGRFAVVEEQDSVFEV
ncbi:MAG: hypothetical protein ACREH5_01750, partial [Candidatus Omnitrophota bacterium]